MRTLEKRSQVIAIAVLLCCCSHAIPAWSQRFLDGIQCDLLPEVPAVEFSIPVHPIGTSQWQRTTSFGELVQNSDQGPYSGFADGWWLHTGIDYTFGQDSSGQMVYASAPGVVIFSSASKMATRDSSGKDVTGRRGGLVVIKHSAQIGQVYDLSEYTRTFARESASINARLPKQRSRFLFTYYLHLNPDAISVKVGEQIAKNDTPIGRLYKKEDVSDKGFAYQPHLHFEAWTACAKEDRNGYDRLAGEEFISHLANPFVDPAVLSGRVPTIDSGAIDAETLLRPEWVLGHPLDRILDAPVEVNALGTVQFGTDSLDAVIKKTGLAFSVHESGMYDCNYVYPPPVIAGLQFMTDRDIVVRADISHPRFKTTSGARVGDTIARLKAIYAGRLEETTERYSDNPQFWVRGVLKGYAMKFETNGTKVTSITTGRVSEVMLDEGCF